MPNQLKNIASLGRYGDTMLAHINPQEAALLKSMGGAGTVNPQTGLREFYTDGRIPAPSTYQAPYGSYDPRAGMPAAPAPFDSKFADVNQLGMGVQQITGYTLPTEGKTFANIPLVTQYDPQGNFKQLTLEPGKYLTPDPSQPNIVSVPRLDASGNVVDWGISDLNNQDNGSFGSMIRELGTEFGPMILTALGANYLAGSGLLGAGAAAPAAGGTLAGMGTGAAGAAATTAATGIPLAALTAGGATEAGLLAGGGSAGGLAGMGTGAAGVNATAAATGLTPAALGVTGLTAALPITSVPTPPTGGGGPASATTPVVSPGGAAGGAVGAGNVLSNLLPTTIPNLTSLIPAATSLIGGAVGANAAENAAQTQADAAIKAAQIQQEMFNTINAQGAPYRASGYNALNQIGSMMPGQYSKYDASGKLIGTDTGTGYFTQQYGPEQFQKDIDPGYAFRLQQGQMANQRASNLAGGLIGGNALRGMQDYTQGMASQEFGNAFNRFQTQRGNIYNTLAGIAGIGQTAQGQANTLAQNNATAQGQLGVGSAAAQAAGQIGSANAIGGALTGAGNAYMLSQLLGQNQGVAGNRSGSNFMNAYNAIG